SAADALCSGTTVMRCDFKALEANSVTTVNISVRAIASGSYMSALKLTSINDMNPANDAREVKIEVTAAAKDSHASGGGGGGRFEWLSLVLLAWLVRRKLVRG